jgi:hypothetical protein
MGYAALPVFMLVILFGCLSQFALAQSNLQSEIPATPTPTAEVNQIPLTDEERETLLRQAAGETFAGRLPPGQVFEIGLTKLAAEWALVNFRVQVAESEAEPGWEVYVALARWDGSGWMVALEGSAEFLTWLDQIPAELLPEEARLFLKPTAAAAANAPGLWLPFPVGQTWKYLAGPNGGPRREAVDFGPFGPGETPSSTPTFPLTGRERDVTAAATGLVVDRTDNLIILRHGSNPAWETGYASLAAAGNISQVGQVIYQGERIGVASDETDSTKGVHLHFWVRQAGVDQVMAGQLLSQWQVYQDNSYGAGQNRGRIVYRTGVERIDCPTIERFGLDSSLCHVPHFSLVPPPQPPATVSLAPASVITVPLGGTTVTSVQVDNARTLYYVALQLSFTPTQPVTIVDAWPDTPGIQVLPGLVFDDVPLTVIRNEVNPNTGVIQFEATRQVPALAFNGSGSLLELTWQRQLTGPVSITLNNVHLADPNGQTLPTSLTTGTIQLQSGFVVQGQVELQGKDNWQGVMVTAASQQAQTAAGGQFQIGVGGAYLLNLAAPGYLSARAEGNPLAMALPDAATVNLGRITLRAGEVTGDDRIDIFDLAFMARYYGQPNLLADINSDGTVNIYDLSLAAANYGQRGPITAWQ